MTWRGWRVDSYTWSQNMAGEFSPPWVTIEALKAIRDDAPTARWCDLAHDAGACEADFDAWYEEVVRPAALEGVKCLVGEDSADFVGGGSLDHEVEGAFGNRSVLICEGLDVHLEIITATKSDRKGEGDYKIVKMSWITPEKS